MMRLFSKFEFSCCPIHGSNHHFRQPMRGGQLKKERPVWEKTRWRTPKVSGRAELRRDQRMDKTTVLTRWGERIKAGPKALVDKKG
jgi:hypothetical protein